jgi:hypothetical protein
MVYSLFFDIRLRSFKTDIRLRSFFDNLKNLVIFTIVTFHIYTKFIIYLLHYKCQVNCI